MKVLYGIQGTGYGHISRAREIIPELSQHASVDVMISGNSKPLDVGSPIKYQKHGISLAYDSNGGVSVLETLRDFRPIRFVSDIQSISLADYDLVISDYEPVSAWSAKLQNIPTVGLSHQASFLSPKTPRPKQHSLIAEGLLQHFAPADYPIGFHFKAYDDFIESPIIRSAIRGLKVSQTDHITVYLPAYHPEVLQKIFAPFTHVDWHIFSPTCEAEIREYNFRIHPVSHQPFLDSLASCRGVICNAGFETCAEAMYLRKKLFAVPIRKQYEQACNAAALQELGVQTLTTLQGKEDKMWHWLEEQGPVAIDDIADPEVVVQRILNLVKPEPQNFQKEPGSIFSLS